MPRQPRRLRHERLSRVKPGLRIFFETDSGTMQFFWDYIPGPIHGDTIDSDLAVSERLDPAAVTALIARIAHNSGRTEAEVRQEMADGLRRLFTPEFHDRVAAQRGSVEEAVRFIDRSQRAIDQWERGESPAE